MTDARQPAGDTKKVSKDHPEQSAAEHAATVREFVDWAVSIDSAADHWWFRDTEGLVAALDALTTLAERAEEAEKALAEVTTAYEAAVTDRARVEQLEDALHACKAWLAQEEEAGLVIPDIVWQLIGAALAGTPGQEP